MRILVVYGQHNGRKWSKEFYCNGAEHTEQSCNRCRVRFECFSSRNKVELHMKGTTIPTPEDVAKYLIPKARVIVTEKRNERGYLVKVAQVELDG